MVGQREMRHAQRLGARNQGFYGRSAIEEREIGMAMQMHERCHAAEAPQWLP